MAQQNQEAEKIVRNLLCNCVWINSHVFGGLPKTGNEKAGTMNGEMASSWVVELRQEEGYGARWLVEEENDNDNDNIGQCSSVAVTFRGFLEPQMEDGHKLRWRH